MKPEKQHGKGSEHTFHSQMAGVVSDFAIKAGILAVSQFLHW